MKNPSYYCPLCHYNFLYNENFELCNCIKPDIYHQISVYYPNLKVLILFDDTFSYSLNFKNNSSRIIFKMKTLLQTNYLLSQDYINNFAGLANYL